MEIAEWAERETQLCYYYRVMHIVETKKHANSKHGWTTTLKEYVCIYFLQNNANNHRRQEDTLERTKFRRNLSVTATLCTMLHWKSRITFAACTKLGAVTLCLRLQTLKRPHFVRLRFQTKLESMP